MIFLYLALIALSFGLLGFLLHAFFFSNQHLVQSLSKQLEDLNKTLASREKQASDAQEEISKARMLVHSLEQQLGQSNEGMSALQRVTRRQEEEIRLLQQRSAETHPDTVQIPKRDASKLEEVPAISDAEQGSGENVSVKIESRIPLWKENLNNILSMLDKMKDEPER